MLADEIDDLAHRVTLTGEGERLQRPEHLAERVGVTAEGRMGEPDDIARVAAFLSSSASDYMTGSMVVVDGGMLLS